ncbi:MAG: hypothetical protein JWM95_556 [Gemmatimonadetes bacterium]|nr:hypothetical protein [Gemmatimonadota bacterium]
MLKDLGLLGIVFAFVPGYIADLAFRACWGMAKGDEFDRSLRAIIWSILGLALFATFLGGPPIFISSLMPGEKSPPAFNWHVGGAFLIDVFLATLAAFLVGSITRWDTARTGFVRVFGRSPTAESPWDALWTRYDKGRVVRIVLTSGKAYLGRVFVASHRADDKELVMYDPSLEMNGIPTALPNVRLLYIAKEQIAEIHLSYTNEEVANVRPAQVDS